MEGLFECHSLKSLCCLQQTLTVDLFYSHFDFLRMFTLSYFPWICEAYFLSSFICGLKPEIRTYVSQYYPYNLIDAYELALIQENALSKPKNSRGIKDRVILVDDTHSAAAGITRASDSVFASGISVPVVDLHHEQHSVEETDSTIQQALLPSQSPLLIRHCLVYMNNIKVVDIGSLRVLNSQSLVADVLTTIESMPATLNKMIQTSNLLIDCCLIHSPSPVFPGDVDCSTTINTIQGVESMGPSPVHVGIPQLVPSISGTTIIDFGTAEDDATGLVATPVSCEATTNEVLRGSVIILNVSSLVVGTLLPNADPFRAQCSPDIDGYDHSFGTKVLNQELALKRNNHDVDDNGLSHVVHPLLYGNQYLVPQEEALANSVSTSSSHVIVTESNEFVAKVDVPIAWKLYDLHDMIEFCVQQALIAGGVGHNPEALDRDFIHYGPWQSHLICCLIPSYPLNGLCVTSELTNRKNDFPLQLTVFRVMNNGSAIKVLVVNILTSSNEDNMGTVSHPTSRTSIQIQNTSRSTYLGHSSHPSYGRVLNGAIDDFLEFVPVVLCYHNGVSEAMFQSDLHFPIFHWCIMCPMDTNLYYALEHHFVMVSTVTTSHKLLIPVHSALMGEAAKIVEASVSLDSRFSGSLGRPLSSMSSNYQLALPLAKYVHTNGTVAVLYIVCCDPGIVHNLFCGFNDSDMFFVGACTLS